ncbi:MAG: phosphate signaling complex protein PhoU [candidate division Zixibacteria bacterium]|nr:phosphate signaling complex protein PhoU [candidate division Zixibacteria bacterium]
MTKHFQTEIDRLKKKILHLAALVEESLHMAVRAVTDRNIELADRVVDGDPVIDSLEIEVEEDCLKILALHQPVAADLRYVVAVLKINSDLERIADLAVNIAERTRDQARNAHMAVAFDLTAMLNRSVMMVRTSVDALVAQDTVKAREVRAEDDVIDNMHRSTFRLIHQLIRENPDKVEYLVCLLSVSRNLERIADHATNIAEDVIYMIEGEIVRHR